MRGLRAFEQLLGAGVLHVQGGFQAVDDRQQALGKGFDGELAHLGDFFVGTPTGVLCLGLGAHRLID